jgi:hypothetical protein
MPFSEISQFIYTGENPGQKRRTMNQLKSLFQPIKGGD